MDISGEDLLETSKEYDEPQSDVPTVQSTPKTVKQQQMTSSQQQQQSTNLSQSQPQQEQINKSSITKALEFLDKEFKSLRSQDKLNEALKYLEKSLQIRKEIFYQMIPPDSTSLSFFF